MLGSLYYAYMFNERRSVMTVGELIELLEQHPKGVEVLIDCRNLDNSIVYLQEDYYHDGTPVVHIDT